MIIKQKDLNIFSWTTFEFWRFRLNFGFRLCDFDRANSVRTFAERDKNYDSVSEAIKCRASVESVILYIVKAIQHRDAERADASHAEQYIICEPKNS